MGVERSADVAQRPRVDETNGAVLARRRQEAAVPAERNAQHRAFAVVAEPAEEHALLHVPHADDLVEAGRGQRPSVGAEGDADDPAGVSLERRAEWRECAWITQPHSSVVAGRSE